jgi:isoleucyl-tRNA synthetase
MAKFHLPTFEAERLKKWEERKVFARLNERNQESGRRPFVFFEGPPTANGKPGIHHILTRAYKDVILRFRSMQGFRIDRKAGWDTHGLPVELQVEKELGFTKKQDIEDYGIAAFNRKCKESVMVYKDLWEKMTARSAVWLDMADPYVTYKNEFVESIWSIMKKVDEKGLLYKGFRVTPHCPRCVTSLSSHELAQGYKDTDDPSVFVKFALADRVNEFFLVWTTTPWTLPANVALAVGKDIIYAKVRMKESGDLLILAKARLEVLDGEYELLDEVSGETLLRQAYQPLFSTLESSGGAASANAKSAYLTYAADFVSTTDGTGIVHIAPAYGEDDNALGKSVDLPTLHTVDATGMVTAEVPGKGRFFKKADDDIKADLTARGLLYKSGTIKHTYPFCWRCDTPILYYAKSSWYIRMSSLRDGLQARNSTVNWVPDHIRDGRFGEWLKDAKDWALSRERYWGTPLPVWECAAEGCGEKRVIGSLDELEASALPKNRYFLQRHGRAESNDAAILSSWPESVPHHLTAAGREKVALAAAELKGKGIDLIFASDLTRTKETAEIIAKELGLSIVFDERLREIGTGSFNERPVAEYEAARAAQADRFDNAPGDGAESLNDVRRRMVAFFKEVDTAHRGKNILIVSHGDTLWMLATAFKGLSHDEVLNWPHYNHTGQFLEMDPVRNLPYDELGEVDVHRPFIDDVRIACAKCGGEMKRVKDVMDVWFDSGAMPYAQWHYPFENAERVDAGTNYPADFIAEAIDQTRGWFYTLLAVATLMDKPAPYKNVICLGHVFDGKGKKMSKSKGNVIDPFEAMDKYGADVIRWFFFSVNQPGDAKRFDERAIDDVTKKVFLILWNVLSYYKMYAAPDALAVTVAPKPKHALDRWVLAEFAAVSGRVASSMEAYDVVTACRDIAAFINDLSTWYVRRSRDRFKAGTDAEKAEAIATLGFVLHGLSKVMAPFVPFLADELYAETGGTGDSVHLEEWHGETLAALDDAALRKSMTWVRSAASAGLEKRSAAAMPVRQALSKAIVTTPEKREDWLVEILKDELNVLDVDWASGEFAIELDTVLTPELKRMGAARELVRNINDARKTAGLTIQDRIDIVYATESDFWKEVVVERGSEVVAGTLARGIAVGAPAEPKTLEFDGQTVEFAIVKL